METKRAILCKDGSFLDSTNSPLCFRVIVVCLALGLRNAN
jgi:hypothetical protein